ncbi:MAG: hypothetical protein HZC24_10885 [Rhodocyclales bacterium]|nr:hypothetical protein [Rhodocyclales bacterium]
MSAADVGDDRPVRPLQQLPRALAQQRRVVGDGRIVLFEFAQAGEHGLDLQHQDFRGDVDVGRKVVLVDGQDGARDQDIEGDQTLFALVDFVEQLHRIDQRGAFIGDDDRNQDKIDAHRGQRQQSLEGKGSFGAPRDGRRHGGPTFEACFLLYVVRHSC